jgi:hypothetical protein
MGDVPNRVPDFRFWALSRHVREGDECQLLTLSKHPITHSLRAVVSGQTVRR